MGNSAHIEYFRSPVADVTAFVEVKTRSGYYFGLPVEAVTVDKQRRLRRLAALYLQCERGPWVRVRFDVVSVLLLPDSEPILEHHKAAF